MRTIKIKNLRREETEYRWYNPLSKKYVEEVGVKYSWTVIYDYYGDTIQDNHCTNKAGEGIFDSDTMQQITGTCQFSLHQKTLSGVRRALKRYYGTD